ncbi:MAG TPA: hypothetical protein VM737_11160 [Gemmatimonadota bacterium]|nr:hypothetical protein [Gemmatimonadota bacterium]
MADSLDVVAVGIEHVRAVVVLVVLGADPGWPVVRPARRESGLVERVHGPAIGRAEGEMGGRARVAPLGEPEVEPPLRRAEADVPAARHPDRVAERCQGLLVESPGPGEVADLEPDVVEHGGA